MAKDMETAQRVILENPKMWTHWVLPMVKRTPNGTLLGFVRNEPRPEGAWKVYIGNIFGGNTRDNGVSETYPDLEALYDAGWRVD